MPVPETSLPWGYTSITHADETILASKDLIGHLPMPAENPDVAGNKSESALCPKKRKSRKNRQLTPDAHLTPTPSGSYDEFNLIAQAPVGATTARLAYIIQSFVPGTHIGTFHLDDVSFAPVPEPGVYALLSGVGLTGFGLLRRRFRSVA